MAWELLLTSDIGILSLVTIVGVIVIGGFFLRYFARQADIDGRRKGS